MKKTLLTIFKLSLLSQLPAQNLVVNPDAESLPRGTGWTVVSSGAATCLLVPTSNMLNWTMKPNGTANYPFDHTTGANGGTVFFSGCDTYFTGPFEAYQEVDVSADAVAIDLGLQVYTFGGFMQTPVTNQTDQGRFVVDFLDASNAILGVSYKSGWQSEFGGSGIGWNNYSSTRTAPAGTRKIKIRLQTQLYINQPAINVYFDDISLTKIAIVPLTLLSFSGSELDGTIQLNWQTTHELNVAQFELERSQDGTHFSNIAVLQAGQFSYQFIDANNPHTSSRYFYRLKIKDRDGKIAYSKIVTVSTVKKVVISLSPNPATDMLYVNGLTAAGNISIINYSGSTVLSATTNSSTVKLNIAALPAGMYLVRFSNQNGSTTKKLLIQR